MDTLDHSFHGITVPFDDPKRMQLLFQIMTGVDKGRSGWEDRGILKRHMESVRAHSGKVARAAGLFCLMHPELGLNLFKMMQMALFHDMAEYKVRDYTPGEIPDEEKYKQEKLVFEELVPYLGQGVLDLREEYEAGQTLEAKIVKQLDKLDAGVKALDYEHRLGYTEHRMDEFYPYTKKKLEHPTLIKIFDILLKKKYKNVHYTEQYYLLLKLKGDEEVFDRIMQGEENLA